MTKKLKKAIMLVLMLCMIVSSVPATEVSAASTTQMKTDIGLDVNGMYEDETLKVDVLLEGIPYTEKEEANDVIMILDKSGSMSGDFENLRAAAKRFVNSTLKDKGVHRIGIVAFSSQDDIDSIEITTDKNKLIDFLNSLQCGGTTFTGGAVEEAMRLLQKKRGDATGAIVLMTDGGNSDGNAPFEAAQRAKQNRYVFYTVAFCNQGTGADAVLRKMATSETDHYSIFNSVQLDSVYASISKKIGSVNPKDLIITQTINAPFELVSGSTATNIPQPQEKGNTLVWSVNHLGGPLVLSYEVKLMEGYGVGTYSVGTGYVQYTDYNNGKQLVYFPEHSVKVETRTPIITDITPDSVLSSNADAMTITGEYFKPSAKVYVGTTLVSDSVVVDENTITFTMPDCPMGTAKVTVKNPDGKQASTTVEVLSNVHIIDIQANSCIEGESPIITIVGTGFYGKAKTIKVMVGTKYASVQTVSGSTEITCKLPSSLTAGAYDVMVINASKKGTAIKTGGFTVNSKPVPVVEIESVTPDVFIENTSNVITIVGKGFYKSNKALKVKVGDKYASIKTSTKTADGCIITCTVPSTLADGTHDVTVTNSQGTEIATKYQAYTRVPDPAPVPEITEVIPGTIASPQDVITINGTEFTDKSSLAKVEIVNTLTGVMKYATIDYASKTQYLIRVPSSLPAGRYDVRIINYGGIIIEKLDALEIVW